MSIQVRVGPPTITINQGSTFMVTNQRGEIDPESEQGLYDGDTRLLSFYRSYINGEPWQLLNSGAVSYYAARHHFTNPSVPIESGTLQPDLIGLTVTRMIGDGVHEDLDITSYAREPVSFMLEIGLRSDFADIFEVKERRFYRRGRVATTWDEARGEMASVYANKDFERRLIYRVVNSMSPARYANGRVVLEITLLPGESWHTCAFYMYARGKDALVREPAYRCGEVHDGATAFDKLQVEWRNMVTQLTSSNDDVKRTFRQSVEDMGALRLHEHDLAPDVWIPAAGVPWFATLFGRDSLVASLQNMILHPPFAIGALTKLGQYQAKERDDWRDAQPGKILHELRTGELAHFRKTPHTPYYGTADATILYLVTLHEAWKWMGDPDILHQNREVTLGCLEWIDKYGDLDGDGFQEYKTFSSSGYENMGWKDASDAVVYPDGNIVRQPKALCELQGYVYDAKVRMAEVFEVLCEPDRAETLREQANDLQRRFDETFWMEDEGFIAYGLDSEKRQIKTIASNAGHCLWSGIVRPDRAERVVRRFMQDDVLTGWGIRTLSSQNPAFNPFSYHNGSIWPHDNGIIALGFKRYGFTAEANEVARGIFDAAGCFSSYRLPELYSGLSRGASSFPLQYLGASVPQAWAAGAVFHLIQAILGLEADAPKGRLYVAPTLPDWLPDIELANLKVGDSVLRLRFWRENGASRWKVLDRLGAIQVVDRREEPLR